MNTEQARKHIRNLRGFYTHLGAYVAVNLFLVMVNLVTSSEFFWFLFPMFGWGIGLSIHAVVVFLAGSGWEARKMEQLTGLTQTKDEIAKLSDRAETLITILSSIDWEKVDPDLVRTRDDLSQVQKDIRQLDDGEGPIDAEKMQKQIERLEEFVTSPKFAYYDQAAKEG